MKLIVRGADYAMTDSITDGCLRAARCGILTDVGLMTNNAAQAQREAASAAETMRRAQLQEQGQMTRAQMQEQGQNTRFGAEMQRNLNRDALDSSVTQQELAMKQSDFADKAAERGFGIRKAQAEEALTNAYLDPNTSDSERARIGQRQPTP